MWFTEPATSDEHVYHRKLPSGGYVAIATEPVQPLFAPAKIRGRIVVERRGEDRRDGHRPPIVAIAEREDLNEVLSALIPIAESDAMLSDTLARGVTMPITRRRAQPEG